LVWLEAMARAKVVLTSRIGVADDVVGRIDRKLVVPAGDVEAMARIVIALRDDRPGLERLSRTGQALLAREFTVEAWSERVTAALRRTLDDAATTQRRPA
jgi:glycosyltransferase involved in cell wall biosynthesis